VYVCYATWAEGHARCDESVAQAMGSIVVYSICFNWGKVVASSVTGEKEKARRGSDRMPVTIRCGGVASCMPMGVSGPITSV
jgi:hypothetical protein